MLKKKEDCLPHTLLLAIANRSSLEEISAACVHTERSQKVLGVCDKDSYIKVVHKGLQIKSFRRPI